MLPYITYRHNFNGRKKSIAKFYQQLYQRKIDLVDKGFKHSMLVAYESEQIDSKVGDIVGFTEVGMLPSPLQLKQPKPIEIKSAAEGIIECEEKEKEENMTDNCEVGQVIKKGDVPYLGNVVVSKNRWRQGIASKLVKVICYFKFWMIFEHCENFIEL